MATINATKPIETYNAGLAGSPLERSPLLIITGAVVLLHVLTNGRYGKCGEQGAIEILGRARISFRGRSAERIQDGCVDIRSPRRRR